MKRSAFAPDHHHNTPTAPPQSPDSAGMSLGWVYGSVILQWSLAQSPVRKSPQCPRGEDNATVECGSSIEVCAYHRDHEAFFIFRTYFSHCSLITPIGEAVCFWISGNCLPGVLVFVSRLRFRTAVISRHVPFCFPPRTILGSHLCAGVTWDEAIILLIRALFARYCCV